MAPDRGRSGEGELAQAPVGEDLVRDAVIEAGDDVEGAVGQPGVLHRLGEEQGGERGGRRRPDDDGAAGGEGGPIRAATRSRTVSPGCDW